MFEWIIFGLIAAVTITACITISALRKAMAKANINIGEIIDIDGVRNVVKLQDLESRVQITVTGDDISDDLYLGQKIRRQPVAVASKNEAHKSFVSTETEAIWAAQLADNERRLKEAQERGSLFTPEEERMFEAMENDPELAALSAAQFKAMEDAEKNGRSLLFIGDNY